ncbi:Crp/Fnr family transcriptional regulator [Brevundimonas sp. M20]|jgi:CRP-like cAMP-binding protein|uniref:Crp/Fnr family transcriptional regulator n=1 Tax=Brevundimonas sp. M20 TaxID=2591463 RepID=UPI001146BCFC|nr:Crp/Fnr family transcriptional regulator [Brevundimonas sp. M20]QDH72414.1 Crp/Fnr family transcriptional regulator [Brevundimonas sp. M20]
MNGIQAGNRLIAALGPADRAALLAHTVPVEFPPGQIFHEPGDPIDHVYFIDQGIVSAVAVLHDGRTVETVMVGFEGVAGGLAAAVPQPAFTRNVAQMAGAARRIDAARLRALVAERPAIREVLSVYLAALQAELEQSAACNALHRAEQRLAKWLLRCHDRVDGAAFNLTQEYMASMLGSQRTTMNEAAQNLLKLGAITYSRGRITVTDRAALERAACECYRAADVFHLTL